MAIPTGFWTVNLEATANRMNQNLIQFDTAANRPAAAAGAKGMLYFATDTRVLSYDNGGAWVTLGTVVEATTKGDLLTFSTLPLRLGVGSNDQVLIADSAQAAGIKWGTTPGGLQLAGEDNAEG